MCGTRIFLSQILTILWTKVCDCLELCLLPCPSLFLAKLKCIYKILKLNKNNFKFLFFSLKKTKMIKMLVILYHAGWISFVHDLMKILVIPIFFENTRCFKHLRKIFENHHLEICMAKKIPTFFLKQDFYLYGQ